MTQQRQASARGGAVVRSGLLTMIALVALGGTRLVHGSLVSRATDHETYALVGTLIGVALTAGLFLPGGLASAASKFIPYQRGSGNPHAARAVHRLLSRAGYVCAALLGGAVGLGASAWVELPAGEAVSVALLTGAFSLYSVEKGALYGFDRVAPYVRLEVICSAVAIGSTVLVVAAGWHAYLAPLTLGYSVLVLGGWWTLRRASPAVGDGPSVGDLAVGDLAVDVAGVDRREIAGYIGLASVGSLASAGLLQLLPLLAGRFTTPVEVSYFVAAVTLVAPLYFLPRALGLALFPALAHAHGAGDLDAVRGHTDVSTRALFVLLAPVFVMATLVAREVLVLFGGPKYSGGAAVLQVLLVATYVAVVQVAAVNALSSGTARDVRIPVASAVVGSLVGLGALVPMGHWFGAAGVGVAYLIAIAVGAAGPLVAAWRRYGMSWAGPVTRSLVVVGSAFVLARAVDVLAVAGPPGVLLDVGLSLLAFAAGVAVLRRDAGDVVRLARGQSPGRLDDPQVHLRDLDR